MILPAQFATTSLIITLLVLLSYFLLVISSPVKSLINRFSSEENSSLNWRMYERLIGILILGPLPAFLIFITTQRNEAEIIFFTGTISRFYLVPICCTVILIVNFFATGKPANRKGYPLIRNKNWTRSLMLANQLSWAAYLFAYEYLIRGVLLSSSIILIGFRAAIIINVVLYALLHFHRGIKQVVFSIPFGVVLCLVTILTNSWISAALLHTAFATSYEFFVIAHRKKWWHSSAKHSSSANTEPAFLSHKYIS